MVSRSGWLFILIASVLGQRVHGSPTVTATSSSSTSEDSHGTSTARELAVVNWSVLSYDDFESGTSWGNYESGGHQARLENRSLFNDFFPSKVSATVRDDFLPPQTASSFSHRSFINISTMDDLRLHFYYYTEKMETRRRFRFFIEYTTDDLTWRPVVEMSRFSDEVPLEKRILFSSSSIDVVPMSKIKLRFRCQGADRTTKVYVDNIRLEGIIMMDTPVAPREHTSPALDPVCPVDRLYPPYKYEILPYDPPLNTPGVEDDLSEISGLAFSDQTDAQGNLYAYAASDKNQFSLKVLKFHRHSQTGRPVLNTTTTVATYELDVHYSNSDWEDLSLGPCNNASTAPTCIYVGDFGNNNRGAPYEQRHVLRILKFREPNFSGSTPRSLSKIPVTTILFEYARPGWKSTAFYDAEAMFVDWVGSGKGDIYVVTKAKCPLGGIGRIPASYHGGLRRRNIPSDTYMPNGTFVYPMDRDMTTPPKQGKNITCGHVDFRVWQGADMRRDGQLIALLAGASPPSVYFYSRAVSAGETVISALSSPRGVSASCDYIASTSYGPSPEEKRHEVVAFLPDGKTFADTSECHDGRRCNVPIYFWDLVYPSPPAPSFENRTVPVDGWQMLAFENFENGTLGTFSGGAKASASSTFACQNGTNSSRWSAQISEQSGEASSIVHRNDYNASNYSWLKVEFDFLLDGFDHMDTFFLELSLDSGRSFFIVSDWAMDTQGIVSLRKCYDTNTVVLNSKVFGRRTFGPNVRLRFRTSANAINDQLYLDNIRLQGRPPVP